MIFSETFLNDSTGYVQRQVTVQVWQQLKTALETKEGRGLGTNCYWSVRPTALFIYWPKTKFTGEKWKLLIQQKPREDGNVHLSEPMLQIRDHYINILVIKNTCNNNHNINSYFEEVKLNYSKCGNGLTSPDRNYHSIGVPEVCVVVSRSDTTCIRM